MAALLCQVRLGQVVVVAHPIQAILREPLQRRGAQLPAEALSDLLAFERRLEFDDIAFGLAGQPVEVVDVIGRHGHSGMTADHAVRQERSAGQSVWPTAGPAADHESVDPEDLRDPLDVGDDVGHRAVAQSRRLSVAGSVEGEPAQAVAPVDRRVLPPADPSAGRPVDREPWQPLRVAPLGNGERTAVGHLDPMLDVLGDDVRVANHVDLLYGAAA